MSSDVRIDVDVNLDMDVAALTAKQHAAVMRGLIQAGNEVRTRALPRTPKLRGHLRSTAEVVTDRDNLTVAVSYNTPYAVYQHERLDLQHTEGEAKYLERTVNESHDVINEMIAAELRRVLS